MAIGQLMLRCDIPTKMWRSSWHTALRAKSRGDARYIQRKMANAKASPSSATYALASASLAVAAIITYNTREKNTQFEAKLGKTSVLSRNFIADAVEKAFPAVVNIAVDSGYVGSNGSGFIITQKGLIVTNAHVLARCNRYSKIQVTFADGKNYPAVIHSTDPLSDIALLQIKSDEVKTWPMISIGSSSELRAGEWVCALGSPFSLQNSVSAGIISAVARHSSELGYPQRGGEYIQTDAAINAGNSGGPLINLDGEVIGINTMKVDGSVGISFAIPADTAVQEISRMFSDVTEGVIVKSITPGSPAHKGGLLPGDVIVSFDGKKVRNTKDILTAVGYIIGRDIPIHVKRRGKKDLVKLKVTTGPMPAMMGAL
ncbi:serine protease mitochondrial isoform x1 [Plasmopara halstedii]|uniref:Serine protease mitochondrial isoform x1 n=1 Tax=Plasmopara halstedii TaxID=4781 RepID=A0A0P1AYF0_PLAHL|nr:serine protease mitochondrial isoform x1 [Plasmopara halstedii]CEG47476.1 serine protease mitochondrial isoform x1 [Plasmopara halstedii]|eukprot:XP_024583845.1 serine protease mitochondrial isoform x1 [Plasmopara halstedii]